MLLGRINIGIPKQCLTALCPAKLPVVMASVCPTNSPDFSPPTKRFSNPFTFISSVLGATDKYLIEFPFPPA